jgi:hypothetical protein
LIFLRSGTVWAGRFPVGVACLGRGADALQACGLTWRAALGKATKGKGDCRVGALVLVPREPVPMETMVGE